MMNPHSFSWHEDATSVLLSQPFDSTSSSSSKGPFITSFRISFSHCFPFHLTPLHPILLLIPSSLVLIRSSLSFLLSARPLTSSPPSFSSFLLLFTCFSSYTLHWNIISIILFPPLAPPVQSLLFHSLFLFLFHIVKVPFLVIGASVSVRVLFLGDSFRYCI